MSNPKSQIANRKSQIVLLLALALLIGSPAPAHAAGRCFALPGDVRYDARAGRYTAGNSSQVYIWVRAGGHQLNWAVGPDTSPYPDMAADPWTPDRLCIETAGRAVYVRNIRRSGTIVAPHPITAVVIRGASDRDTERQ